MKEMIRQKGIPPDLRSKIWPILCGTIDRQSSNPQLYRNILREHSGEASNSLDQISRDVGRTFPEFPLFKTQEGSDRLRRILEAFSWRHPEIGYCQSLNFVVGAFMLAGVQEEQSFWLLEEAVCRLLPPHFYSPSLADLRRDLVVLSKLVETELPVIHNHFERLGVSSSIFAITWFMCLFINVFPLELSLRFLDCFFYEGSKALFRVSLGLLKLHQEQILKTRDTFECLAFCKELPTSRAVKKFEDLFQPHWDLGEVSSLRIQQLREISSITVISEDSDTQSAGREQKK